MSQKTERLVNLTIALLETRRPLPLSELQQKTGYYTGAEPDAARRMFERDKDDLRSMGVPIETKPIPYSDDIGYIINRQQYEMPDPTFTRDEITALALAQQQAANPTVGLAFAKIAARAPDPDSSATALGVPVTIYDSLYPPELLTEVVREQRTIKFTYRPATHEPSVRTVDPYAIVRRRGNWYLIGHDHTRAGIRSYRVDRIDGTIVAVSEPNAFSVPDSLDLRNEVLPASEELHTVTGNVKTTHVAQLIQRGAVTEPVSNQSDTDWLPFTLGNVDIGRDLPWLMAFGNALVISGPEPIQAAIQRSVRAVHAAHRPSS